MENINKYDFYRLEKKHLKDVRYILKKTYNKSVSVEFLEKKYDCSFLGIDRVSTIAYNGHNPIAFYGAIPQLFTNGNTSFLAAHICDSFTLPEYQKQGIYYRLSKLSFEFMQVSGFKMAYAFHSKNTYYSSKKQQMFEHGSMFRFHFKTGAFPISKIWNKLHLNSYLELRFKAVFKSYLIDYMNNPLIIEGKTCQDYSDSFFQYKDSYNRHFMISIENCRFYVKPGSVLSIGFFDYPEIKALQLAIKKLKQLTAKVGIAELLFQVDPSTLQYRGLSSFANPLPSWPIGYFPLENSINIQSFGFNFSDFDTF